MNRLPMPSRHPDKDIRLMERPDLWPIANRLPVKRSFDNGDDESGYIVPNDPTCVWISMSSPGGTTSERPQVYNNAGEIVRDGWEVD